MANYAATITLLIIQQLTPTNSWDLNHFNISSNYYISSIAIFGNRAFLSLPRSICHNNHTQPTIIELSWNAWYWDHQSTPIDPNKSSFAHYQDWTNCSHIQDAISLDVDPLRTRLWILDRGNRFCGCGKIVVYHLFQKTLINYDLNNLSNCDKLNYIIVDTNLHNTRAYIGFIDVDQLLVFSLNDKNWWIVDVKAPTEFLTISKTNTLFMTGGKNRGLYSINLHELIDEMSQFEAENLGEKLGDSSGLVADLKNGLIYYLTNDYAVVRWDMRHPSQAESYTILAQSYEILPYVSQLYTGPQNGIWALANPQSPHDCARNTSLEFNLKKRLIKILKYNNFM